MKKVWAYLRVSTDEQDLLRQRLEVLKYSNKEQTTIDRFVENTVSSRQNEEKRGIKFLKEAAKVGEFHVLYVSELSRLGRSVGELVRIIESLVDTLGVEIHCIKEGMILRKGPRDIATKVMLSTFGLLAEIERDLISERTKSGLAARKKAGVKLGRPRRSKLDAHEMEIRRLLNDGVKQKRIAQRFECSEVNLSNWLKRKRPAWATGR
jgi:DNA invertase Pin-like site-specific DNA recombinase